MWRLALLTLSATLLSGCSYVYDLLAVVRNGELIFVVSEQSPSDPRVETQSQPECHSGSEAYG